MLFEATFFNACIRAKRAGLVLSSTSCEYTSCCSGSLEKCKETPTHGKKGHHEICLVCATLWFQGLQGEGGLVFTPSTQGALYDATVALCDWLELDWFWTQSMLQGWDGEPHMKSSQHTSSGAKNGWDRGAYLLGKKLRRKLDPGFNLGGR